MQNENIDDWVPDKIVRPNWSSINITGFGDEEDETI